jgi:hypothetical protein
MVPPRVRYAVLSLDFTQNAEATGLMVVRDLRDVVLSNDMTDGDHLTQFRHSWNSDCTDCYASNAVGDDRLRDEGTLMRQ